MKTIVLKIVVIILILAEGVVSCGENEEIQQYVTPLYQKCECEYETKYIKTIERKNILLSNSTENIDRMFTKEYMIYDFVLNYSIFVMYEGRTTLCNICNFPFDKLNVPKDRLSISFIADIYETCTSSESLNIPHYDIVLTSFKIETK